MKWSDLLTYTFIKKIGGHSFRISSNGLSLIPREETQSNNTILFCACKKYLSNQKNGILLVNVQTEENEDIKVSKCLNSQNQTFYGFFFNYRQDEIEQNKRGHDAPPVRAIVCHACARHREVCQDRVFVLHDRRRGKQADKGESMPRGQDKEAA